MENSIVLLRLSAYCHNNIFFAILVLFFTPATLRNDQSNTEKHQFARIAAGDEAAFQQLFHQYNKVLFPFIISLVKAQADAEEIVQDVFLKLWLNREKLTAIENPGGWLRTVTANAAYDHLQKMAGYEVLLSNFQRRQHGSEKPFWQELDARLNWEAVINQIRKLPLRQRQVLQLSRIEGLSRKEIARKLGISENTVRNHLADATLFLKDLLQNDMLLLALTIMLAAG